MKKSGKTALFEIGTEEIPARFLPDAASQLEQNARRELEKSGVEFSGLSVFSTPRRLALFIEGVAPKVKDRLDEFVGPPPKAAKDSEGKWTQAALGFARSHKTPVENLILKTTPKGERYVFEKTVKGRKTELVLQDVFPSLAASLSFPKSMVWEKNRFRFARPIRWMVAMLNTQIIRFRAAGVSSDRVSYGLLALGSQKITIPRSERYAALLQSRCVLTNPAERKKKILQQIDALAKKIKAAPILTEDHLTELVNLTEYPTSLLGHFPDSYLALPREVLIRVMRNHQKFVPLQMSSRKLANAFIGVRNGPSEAQDVVRDGYERVLNARLADARFFFEMDKKSPLEKFAEKLSGVGFIEGLGTMADKTNRLASLADTLGRALSLEPEARQKTGRAARLAKADLLTQIVGEFPELQGLAGRFYGDLQNEGSEAAAAIEEHYWPLTADGPLPESNVSGVLAVADKMDNLAAHFYADHIPTGSADPYALRRQSVGVIRILFEKKWPLTLPRLVEIAFEFDLYAGEKKKKAADELRSFLTQRLAQWLVARSYRSDEIEAVLADGNQSISDIVRKLDGFQSVRGRPEFASLAAAVKRARNIRRQAEGKGIRVEPFSGDGNGHLSETAEKSLWSALRDTQPKVADAMASRDYDRALVELAALKGPVDAFFDGVMVMVEDAETRDRRLSLLRSIEDLFDRFADFSKLQIAGDR